MKKKSEAGQHILFHFLYRLTITINSPCCKTISFTGVGVGGYIVANFWAMAVCRHWMPYCRSFASMLISLKSTGFSRKPFGIGVTAIARTVLVAYWAVKLT